MTVTCCSRKVSAVTRAMLPMSALLAIIAVGEYSSLPTGS